MKTGNLYCDISVPAGSEHRREEVTQATLNAIAILEGFARANAWIHLMKDQFFDCIEIFSSKETLWERLLETNQLPPDMPAPTDAVTAVIEKNVLMAVFFEEAQRSRPEYFKTHLDWVQALAHEMVHQLHIRILNGDEEAMGPQWFYEGFAIIGSSQPLGQDIYVQDVEKALELTVATGRGSYASYAAALRFLMERIPLHRLVAYAANPDFVNMLRTEASTG